MAAQQHHSSHPSADTQTDRQTDTQTNRQTDRQMQGQTKRHTTITARFHTVVFVWGGTNHWKHSVWNILRLGGSGGLLSRKFFLNLRLLLGPQNVGS